MSFAIRRRPSSVVETAPMPAVKARLTSSGTKVSSVCRAEPGGEPRSWRSSAAGEAVGPAGGGGPAVADGADGGGAAADAGGDEAAADAGAVGGGAGDAAGGVGGGGVSRSFGAMVSS